MLAARVFFVAREAHQAVEIEKLVFQGALRHQRHKEAAISVGGVELQQSSSKILSDCLRFHAFRIHFLLIITSD